MESTSRQWMQGRSRGRALALCAALAASAGAFAAEQGAAPAAEAAEQGAAPAARAETAESAFQKLDAGGKGYVTLDDVAQLPGFDKAFRAVDVKQSGRLGLAEFRKAWSMYLAPPRG